MGDEQPVRMRQSPPEYLEVYALYRERVYQEDQLINHRMGWLLWSNAILLAFFAAILSDGAAQATADMHYVPDCVIALGLLCTAGCGYALRAAQAEIDYLKEIFDERYPEIVSAQQRGLLPSIIGHKRHHFMGWIARLSIPSSMMLIWVFLFMFRHIRLV